MARSAESYSFRNPVRRSIRERVRRVKEVVREALERDEEGFTRLVVDLFYGEDAPYNPWGKPFEAFESRMLPQGEIGGVVLLHWGNDLAKVVEVVKDERDSVHVDEIGFIRTSD
jgi:hypothetical protein